MIAEFQIDIKQRLGIFVAEINVFGTILTSFLGSETFIFQYVWAEENAQRRTQKDALCRGARTLFFLARQADGRLVT